MTHGSYLAEARLIDTYVAEVNKHELLTREQEVELARELARTGEPTVAHRLVVANLRFVVKVAHEFRGYGVALLDLVQEGNVGLMLAVKKFDPERGYRLISYAVWWIRAYIQSYVMRTWSMVKIGTTVAQRKLFFKIRSERQQAEMSRAPGERADPAELARTLGVNESDVTEMELRLAARDYSLNANVGEGRKAAFVDMLPGRESTPEEIVSAGQQRHRWLKQLERATADLDERERYILNARLRTDQPQTLREIGERFRISRERVRQIQENVVQKLRSVLVDGEAEVIAA